MAGGWAFGYEPSALRVENVTVAVKGLHPDLAGFRIALLTDLHVGPYTGKEFIARAVALANDAAPDLALLGGDYVHRSGRYFAPCAEAVAELRAPFGVHGVTGNHDYWEGVEICSRTFADARVALLRNRAVPIERGAGRLWLAGVDDLMVRAADPIAAMSRVPHGEPTVLLSHNPDLAELLPPSLPVSLMLSGHTHGGQIRLPLLGSPVVPSRYGQKYVAGLAYRGEMAVYTSRGIGTISPPVRLNCPPEVSLVTLQPA